MWQRTGAYTLWPTNTAFMMPWPAWTLKVLSCSPGFPSSGFRESGGCSAVTCACSLQDPIRNTLPIRCLAAAAGTWPAIGVDTLPWDMLGQTATHLHGWHAKHAHQLWCWNLLTCSCCRADRTAVLLYIVVLFSSRIVVTPTNV